MRCLRYAVLGAGLLLATSGAARPANLPYKIQPIATLGDTVAAVPLPKNGTFFLGRLSDDGQILFDVSDGPTDRLIHYAGGEFTPIGFPGGDGPIGKWPKSFFGFGPGAESMNQSGQVVFAAGSGVGGPALGTFLWDSKTASSTSVAMKKMPAASGLTFTEPGGFVPVINNRSEIALVAGVSGTGVPFGSGLFFRKADGSFQTVLLPGQALTGGGKTQTDNWLQPSINDAGQVAFLTRRQGDRQNSAYLWESGALTPVLVVGTNLPGIGKVHGVSSVLLNNQNASMLVTATIEGADVARHGLYSIVGGTVSPVAAPGQTMPDGGTFRTMNSFSSGPNGEGVSLDVSAANAAGQHAFIASLDGGATAAYLVDADGKLSPILRSGAVTDLGTITSLGSGTSGGINVSLNSQGQVLLVASIDKGPKTLLLLTPAAP
jgi:hypothetical protein